MSDLPKRGMMVRPMRLGDVSEVVEIDRLSFSMPWSARSYRFEIERNPAALLFVAEVDGAVLGYIGLWELVDVGHISTLAVHPNHRRQGIARQLIEAGLRALADRGIGEVTLEVRESNTGAQNLYSRFGFEVVGRRREYYRDNREDALVMTLEDVHSVIAQEV